MLILHCSPTRLTHGLATLLIAVSGLFSSPTFADASEQTPAIVVSPPLAAPGLSREVQINVTWPDACPPDRAYAMPTPPTDPSILIVRLDAPQTLASCAQVRTPNSRTVHFAPGAVGDLPVVVITSTGSPLASGTIITRPESADSLAGIWMGATDEFFLMQLAATADGRPDGVVGTLNLFGRDGSPQWRVLHSSGQTPQGSIEATLTELQGAATKRCVGPVCPGATFSGTVDAIIEIERIAVDRIRVSVSVLSGGTQPPLLRFQSLMSRVRL